MLYKPNYVNNGLLITPQFVLDHEKDFIFSNVIYCAFNKHITKSNGSNIQ